MLKRKIIAKYPLNRSISNKTLAFWSIVKSTLAAVVGIQNKERLEQDFAQKSPLPFILAGIVFTFLLIGGLTLLVKYVVL